jgi:hypothetical protein
MLTFCLHTKCHTPNTSRSLSIGIQPKVKYRFWPVAILLFCNYLNKCSWKNHVFGLCPSSNIFFNHNASETGWTKSKNMILSSAIHHRQNRLKLTQQMSIFRTSLFQDPALSDSSAAPTSKVRMFVCFVYTVSIILCWPLVAKALEAGF